MSALGPGAIGPVSARYAAQIRELLHAQAMKRMAAENEAARAQAEAERAARLKAMHTEPVSIRPAESAARTDTDEAKKAEPAEPAKRPETNEGTAASRGATARIVDELA